MTQSVTNSLIKLYHFLVAMQALKRKKRLEAQLEQILATLITLENQRTTLENSHINAEILGTMKDASKAIKKANEKLDIDKVNNVIDEISEVTDQANEITNALSTLLVPNEDDDEFEKELEKLKQEALNENIFDIPNKLPALPNVPIEEPNRTKNKTKEDQDLKELLEFAN